VSKRVYRHDTQLCPVCGHAIDSATGVVGSGKPRPGLYSVCFYCFAALRFDEQMQLTHVPQDQVPNDVSEIQDAAEAYALDLQRKGNR